MSSRRKLIKRVIKSFLPIVLVVVAAFAAVTVWIVHGITRPPRAPYLVTPQTFSRVTGPLLKATDVTWTNHDGTQARGWLIRGAEGSPAVILLHRYGADRSWLLNLAVKLNETTNFTVLWPDLRGHGENPPVNRTLFGAVDGDDATAAIDYLHTLKSDWGQAPDSRPSRRLRDSVGRLRGAGCREALSGDTRSGAGLSTCFTRRPGSRRDQRTCRDE